MSLHFMKNMTL